MEMSLKATPFPMNLTVFVVDDELPLLDELRSFPWERWNMTLVGEAANGEQAFQRCKRLQPDIVVTDITMPIMDGLELVRQLRSALPATQIILLTCHHEFHYAREALRLGALEYLLKATLDDTELEQALGKARQAISRDRERLLTEKERSRFLLANRLHRLLNGAASSLFEENETIFPGEAKLYRMGQLLWSEISDQEGDDELPGEDATSLPHSLRVALARLEAEAGLAAWAMTGPGRCVLLFAELESMGERELAAKLGEIMEQWRLQLLPESKEEKGSFVKAMLGATFEPNAGVFELKALSAWEEAFFYDWSKLSTITAGHLLPLNELSKRMSLEAGELLRAPATDEGELLADAINGGFRKWCLDRRIKPRQLKEWALQWLLAYQSGLNAAASEPGDALKLIAARTLDDLCEALSKAIMNDEDLPRMRLEIKEAIQWMNANLGSPFSLSHVAEHVGLSPHYISRLFKEETGESMNHYMTRLRMEKAIELLTHTNKRVYEIAAEVGIPSYRYFSVMFRNWTGVSPTSFKR
ncbi:helix-turn-helix domain-containing protein [Paenibacillus sp. HB172176]|uniref:response regulator transcription factor n=1 Tax=Paenibacillus sp. HB172176 TaxID=2493690 RepID=UPI00143BC96F|nr:helix-turn-helix domain-containing protein [Paenibacillus sp. HB172176]